MTRLMELYGLLDAAYGDRHWWPARNHYEMMTGAILTQNTAWSNVERAIEDFGDRLSPQFVSAAEPELIADIIRPAGYFNVKTKRLKALTAWYMSYNCDNDRIAELPDDRLRTELLAVNGVGRETADSIMVYAFGRTSFVVDAYTRRLLSRIGLALPEDYDDIRELIEEQVPREIGVYNQFHALIVEQCKRRCMKKPACDGCPLGGICKNPPE